VNDAPSVINERRVPPLSTFEPTIYGEIATLMRTVPLKSCPLDPISTWLLKGLSADMVPVICRFRLVRLARQYSLVRAIGKCVGEGVHIPIFVILRFTAPGVDLLCPTVSFFFYPFLLLAHGPQKGTIGIKCTFFSRETGQGRAYLRLERSLFGLRGPKTPQYLQ
jgi:hypothetical protein